MSFETPGPPAPARPRRRFRIRAAAGARARAAGSAGSEPAGRSELAARLLVGADLLLATPSRLPSAMLASVRCRPQVASGTALSAGAPVEWRDLQHVGVVAASRTRRCRRPWPRSRSCSPRGRGTPTASVAIPIVVPGAKRSLGKIESSVPAPPPRAAGLVQRMSRVAGSPVESRPPKRPKFESAGTGALKVENPIAQPICSRRLAARDVLEVAADELALLDLDVAAEQVRRRPAACARPVGRRPAGRSAGGGRTSPGSGRAGSIPRPSLYFFR